MRKRIISCILVVFILLFMVLNLGSNITKKVNISEGNIPLSDGRESEAQALEFVSKLGTGWNLGDSFCCCDANSYGAKSVEYYEKLWGNPVITKASIDEIKAKGFKTIRIPITYFNHIDENNQVDVEWLQRIKEVVDYVIEDDMYCIINLHHENWLIADVDKQSGGEKKLELVWKQIAKYFSKYGEKLIFEGFNEVINSAKQWDSASINSYEVVNAYNQTFVNAVRSTGGNNLTRYLIVNTYAAKATKSVLSGFVIPKDNIENRLIVSAHIYDGINEAKNKINNLYNSFICNGIPVVIGEWGLINSSVNTEAKRIEYATQFLKTASEYGIPCLWWDDGGIFKSSSAVTNFCLYKRNTQTWYFNDLVKAIIKEGKPIPFNISNYKADYDPFQMLKIDSWKSGDYHYSTGKYLTNANRICLKEEKKLVAGEKYTATVSDQSFHILVRIMDSDGKFIKSYNLSNRDSFCYETEGYYARISIYNAVNSTICKSFEDYKKLFEKGLKISLNGIIECEDYFESEIGQDSRGENDIKQETTDVFGMADFNNWKSGDYNCNTGCYVSNNSRICLKEYKDVKENQCFVARISDRKYNLLIRFLNKDGKLIKSSAISDGQEIVIPEGSIKIGISLYNFCNSKMEFNNFKELYENGFEALLVRK